MRVSLLTTTALITLATPAAAQTVVNAKRTDPVRTSTIKNGAADAVRIASAGSVEPASGTAVTMDSDNAVTNEGKIAISNANGAIGIAAAAGTTGDIVNSGTITIDESYTPTDQDKDGDLDGPFAVGSDRTGIRTLGAHSGKITHSGTITVEGNDSAGIWLGGTQTGAFTHDGKTSVVGDNSVAVRAEAINGNVRLAGTVTATGANAIAARFTGDVSGAMVVQGAIGATGYRYTTAPSDTSKLDADDLLQGGPALMIEGSVSGGVILAVAPKDSDPNNADEDKDGIEDAKEGNAAIVSYGKAPAMVVGSASRDIAIGAVANTANGYGLIIDGSVAGNGVYSGIDGNGLVIGGQGGAVTIANGMGVAGAVTATSNGGTATALRIGSGASVPELRVSGQVTAQGAQAAAVRVDAGANIATIRNSGTIGAAVNAETGQANAIVDASGGVTLIENSGAIVAKGAKADSNRNIAIDVSANTSGVTVRQTAVAADVTAPSITGDIRFGSGNDVLDLADGSFKGNASFGAGANRMALSGDAQGAGAMTFGAGADTVALAGSSVFSGSVDFGGGADVLTLAGTSRFSGTLANAGALAVNVTGGMLDLQGATTIGSLNMGADGILGVTLSKTAGTGTALNVAGTAAFTKGATLRLSVTDVRNAEGRYVVLTAGQLTGADGIKTDADLLPFLYKGSLATDGAANQIVVNVSRRSAQELGLNRSQTTAYSAVYAALAQDEDVANVFLNIRDGDQFRGTLRQMLPDHAGGTFDGLSLGVRTMARQLADPRSPILTRGKFNLMVTAGGWGTDKKEKDTAAYDLGGLGFAVGGEIETGLGTFGVSGTYLWNKYTSGSSDNEVLFSTYELAGFWHGQWGGFAARARASIGTVDFEGSRYFNGTVGNDTLSRRVEHESNGTMTSFSGGVSYEGGGQVFFFRPAVSIDYLKLTEDGYTETGGGKALDLTVDKRSSDEAAVEGGLTLGMDLSGTGRRDSNWFRMEVEGGWREIVSGSLGTTTARFAGGDAFTLTPQDRANGWYGRLRALGGGSLFQVGGEFGAEKQNDRLGLTLRGTMRVNF
ncbi:autotransporter outer membrane beta-barrel domain-containing protein [Stakelama pacifica]|uniref:Uncharacterized protein with beta-barrel porin domain n=1 Tax=Stakelama pacifica TaxID=517720 RepID=A0A4R6FE96_9SPHN|nr:autotransporter domain-containing protein [Stakelama pacifica]TDN79020.1 uncharacterized protein with beta-barrel porin domain [Stakelama pacifica]GGO98848.1 autotransporter [Stakelama pacifica]